MQSYNFQLRQGSVLNNENAQKLNLIDDSESVRIPVVRLSRLSIHSAESVIQSFQTRSLRTVSLSQFVIRSGSGFGLDEMKKECFAVFFVRGRF